MTPLQNSYRYCREVARTRAANFYYSFTMLPAEQRDAMCAIYTFMRYCDDLSDEPGANRKAMDNWREATEAALEGRPNDNPVWPAFLDSVERFKIPHHYFFDMIEGVASDLEPRTIDTFEELYQYCYRVASVVGLTTIHIFGFTSPEALPLAEKCGIAFQLTNILRDIKEDAERGRIYIPTEDLIQFNVSPEDLKQGRRSEAFGRLMDFEIARARRFYEESEPLLGLIQKKTRRSLWTLIAIYSRLLDHIADRKYDVLERRISLSPFEKMWLVFRSAMGLTG
ncbi:MAG TPA: phytoene/squalene synthase family protein [Bryobacteraceae bacterium]|nr:phytoene/squalene synthase family protein [Bryobacteraceae bacterium]